MSLQPGRDDRASFEQPGCLHAGMDLYKHAFRLTPMICSDLVADCFELARDIRVLDMRAAPYDLADLGFEPVRIETPEGKQEYAAAQRGFAERGDAAAPATDRRVRTPSRRRAHAGWLRNHRWPKGSRNTATRPAGSLSSGPRSSVAPPATTLSTMASTSWTVRWRLIAAPRSAAWRLDLDLRVLVGHHPAGPVHGQLHVTDPAIGHHDRVHRHLGAQMFDVPLDRGSGVGDGEVGRQCAHDSHFVRSGP